MCIINQSLVLFYCSRSGKIWQNANVLHTKEKNVRELSDLGGRVNNLSVLRKKGGDVKIIQSNLNCGGTRDAGDRDDSAGRKRQKDLRNG